MTLPEPSRRPFAFAPSFVLVFAMACAAATVSLAGCRRSESSSSAARNAPVAVASVTPSTVTIRAGEPTELVIRGTGFDAADNAVTLGPVTLTAVPSTDQGTRISVVVPDRVVGRGGAPPLLWVGGAYPLTVTTPRGTSAPITVTVKEPI